MAGDWKKTKEGIQKDFQFRDFSEALEFVNEVGALAEKLNHHPDILLHAYKKVQITSMTHSAGKVTSRDQELAARIDELAN